MQTWISRQGLHVRRRAPSFGRRRRNSKQRSYEQDCAGLVEVLHPVL